MTRKIFRFPAHRCVDPGTAARVIEKDELLNRPRFHLAILAQKKRRLRESVRLTRGIESEDIGFVLLCSCKRVTNRQVEKTYYRNDEQGQRQHRRISHS